MRPNWSGWHSASRISRRTCCARSSRRRTACRSTSRNSPGRSSNRGRRRSPPRRRKVVIPASLHDSLLARLDLLGEAKGVAQLASMLGREFGRDVLAAVVDRQCGYARHGIARLVQAEFIYPASDSTRERYLFKHALIQDAAYESLLKSSRVAHHRRIAEVLETQFAGHRRRGARGRRPPLCRRPGIRNALRNTGSMPAAGRCAATRTSRRPRTCAARSARWAKFPTGRSGPGRTRRADHARHRAGRRQRLRIAGRRGRVDARASSCARSSATCHSSFRRCSACGCTNACAPITAPRSRWARTCCAGRRPCKATTC